MLKKSAYLFLVLFIEGAALMAVELMGAKFAAPFYGSSLYVWTAVLCITVLGLTLGYHFGGKISQQLPSEKTLILILAISSLLVFALPYTVSALISLTAGMDLIMGICITCLLLLLPPMLCFGMVGPMVVRLMADRLETLGRVAGTVYFTSTLGGIIATFLVGFYGIPVMGLKYCAFISAIALALLPLIYFIREMLWGKKEFIPQPPAPQKEPVIKEKLLSKGKKVPAAEKKISNSVYLFVVLEGATVMAIELIAARMIAPYFGSSLYVWGAVIGITLLSLALGYYFGGVLADKYAQLNSLLWVLLIASGFLLFMHFSSQQLTLAFRAMNPKMAVVIISLFLVLPPIFFLGMVPTLLIRYISKKVDAAGSTTGRVYTVSSASGIIALLLIGFYIIPQYGLTVPSIWIGIIVGIVPFFRLLLQKKYISLLFILFVILSFPASKTERSTPGVQVQYYSEGLLGQVMVADVFNHGSADSTIKTNDRILFVNRMGQTFVDRQTGNTKFQYINFAFSVASKLPQNSNALLLGLGGGSVANMLSNLKFNVDAVELDERIANVATDYFGLNANVNVIIDDARHYIEITDKKYDLIIFDLFRGEVMPAHVLTLECFKKAEALLNPNGLLIVNFNGFLSDEIGKPGRSVYKTLVAAGMQTNILPTPGSEEERNSLFLASEKTQDYTTLRSPLLHNGKPVKIDSLFFDPKKLDLKNAIIFTDDKPILELLNLNAAGMWRKGYNKTYTRFFWENGIPLFD